MLLGPHLNPPLSEVMSGTLRFLRKSFRYKARGFSWKALTWTPAFFSASILSVADPLPPEIIAPAWPIRRPGGAVTPAMNATTGFELAPLKHNASLLEKKKELKIHEAAGSKHFAEGDQISF